MFNAVRRMLRRAEPIDAFFAGCCDNTRHTYEGAWKVWAKFLGSKDQMAATEADARKFKVWYEDRAAPNTLKNRVAALSAIYGYFARNHYVDSNIFEIVYHETKKVKAGYVRPTELTHFEDVAAIFEAPRLNTPEDTRNRSILACSYGGGLRACEWRNIKLKDILRDPDGTVYIRLPRSKRARYGEQVLPEWAGKEVLECLKQRHLEEGMAARDSYLHVTYYKDGSYRDEPLDDRTARRLFLALTGHATHSGRATFGTCMYLQGNSVADVAEGMRHASTKATEVYIKRARGHAERPEKKVDYSVFSEGNKKNNKN